MSTIADHIRRNADLERDALLFEDERWTHAEVVREAAARASLLLAEVDAEPLHVGVLLDNTPEAIFWLEAAALCGATVVGLNSTRRGGELLRDLTHTDCAVVVTDAAGLVLLEDIDVAVPVWDVDSAAYREAVQEHAGAPVPDVQVGEDARCVLIFTSGTTSAPKAAIRTQGALVGIAERLVGTWAITADDVAYNAMPWFHSNALYHAIYPSIVTGSTLALRRRFSASGFLDDVRRFGATRFNYVGKVLEYILATPPRPEDRDNRLRIVTGSEASERDIAAFGARFDTYVYDGFGSTESGVGIMRTPDMPAGALGLPPDESTLVLDPATGEECPRARFDGGGRLLNAEEAIGELVNKAGLAAFEGYYNNDEANAERSRLGWYWSGDLGYRDAAGFFYFAGRGYDWLRVDGENFSAAPVERILLRHPDVSLAAVYAVPDPNTGDQLMASLQLVEGASFDPEGFTRFLDAQADLGTKWRPKLVRVVPELPLSHTNKIKKAELRAQGWLAPDPIWWRRDRSDELTPFTPVDAAELAAAFRRSGRVALLPEGQAGTA
jgi:fatty-acyl-CoA synthase